MVYDSDFYTTRRPYRTSPSYSTYTTSKREIPWEKVPFVPRPSLVPDPITAFGKRPAKKEEEVQRPQRRSILDPEERAKIKPKAHLEPVKPYLTARDKTREKVFGDLIRKQLAPNEENMDVVLPRLHKVAECPDLPYKRKIVAYSDLPPYEPSRQVKILPGLGKVHIVHSYDRIVPYVGHKRLTVVSTPPKVYSTRPSVLQREYDWIENKVRPWVGYSATNRYLNSDSAVRIYYSNYPITSSYYTTLSLPSSYYYPRVYRWYYNWPRTYYLPSSYYSSYWPSSLDYYWPRSYYSWPYYRSYLSSFFRNYYLSSLPSLYYKSLDYQFSDLENKINNLSLKNDLYFDR